MFLYVLISYKAVCVTFIQYVPIIGSGVYYAYWFLLLKISRMAKVTIFLLVGNKI